MKENYQKNINQNIISTISENYEAVREECQAWREWRMQRMMTSLN